MSFEASTSAETMNGQTRAGGRAAVAQACAGVDDPLQPLLAGAHARGMADAFELAGVAAVLIDARGLVLHAGTPARNLFGIELRLEHDHLFGGTAESTLCLQDWIAEALSDADLPDPVTIPRPGRSSCKLHARRVAGAAGNPFQLLKLLIIIEEVPALAVGA